MGHLSLGGEREVGIARVSGQAHDGDAPLRREGETVHACVQAPAPRRRKPRRGRCRHCSRRAARSRAAPDSSAVGLVDVPEQRPRRIAPTALCVHARIAEGWARRCMHVRRALGRKAHTLVAQERHRNPQLHEQHVGTGLVPHIRGHGAQRLPCTRNLVPTPRLLPTSCC